MLNWHRYFIKNFEKKIEEKTGTSANGRGQKLAMAAAEKSFRADLDEAYTPSFNKKMGFRKKTLKPEFTVKYT